MLAAIVRSPLALNVAGEEPEHGGLIKIAKPADILVELPTKFTLADNLKSAKRSASPRRNRSSPALTR